MKGIKKVSFTIGIILGDIQSDYSNELLRGFYTCAKEEDINIIFLMGPQAPQYCTDILSVNDNNHYHYQFDTIYDYAHLTKPDALIIACGSLSMSNPSLYINDLLNQYKNIPYLVMEDSFLDPKIPYFTASNYDGMKSVMEHLIVVHKYQKIAFISGPMNNSDAKERLLAYSDSMKAHHLPISQSMIAYGNFSENIDDIVESILLKNPGLEAIAFANDNMAKSGYRVCTRHNLIIGQDIAITGFDDVEFAQTLTPPLTSVSHSSFLFSYAAIKNAIAMCRHQQVTSEKIPCIFKKRCSCGCTHEPDSLSIRIAPNDLEEFLANSIDTIAKELLEAIPYKNHQLFLYHLIKDFFSYIYQNAFIYKFLDTHNNYLSTILQKLLDYKHISHTLMIQKFSNILEVLRANAPDPRTQEIIADVISSVHQYIHAKEVTRLENEVISSQRQAWFIPTFTRDLINGELGMRHTMNSLIERLKMLNITSAYFYLYEHPIVYDSHIFYANEVSLFLTAYYNQKEQHYYRRDERPMIDTNNGFSSFLPNEKGQCLCSFVLFSGLEQYGILVCEASQEDLAFIQICSLQIGSLLRFISLNQKEKHIQKKLNESFHLIQEKNDILRFISEYDDLTNLLNRRGFMEQAIRLCKINYGKIAYLVFGDLDHLKEINDSFGHRNGDFALKTAADILKQSLPKDSLIARTGGDEFLAITLSENPNFIDDFSLQIAQNENTVNQTSSKPYFVEMSLGTYKFTCSPEIDLNEIIHKADVCLYKNKAHRRDSIKKSSV